VADSSSDCLFCRIAAGPVPAAVVFEDESSLAFLDHRPVFPGHTLLIPRQHIPTLADLPGPLIKPFFCNAQLLARAIESALASDGSFVAINNRVSQSVPHLHVHIVPRRKRDGLRGFFWPRQPYKTSEEMEEIRKIVADTVRRLRGGG
jgi:histidine triad (HIT) family protein